MLRHRCPPTTAKSLGDGRRSRRAPTRDPGSLTTRSDRHTCAAHTAPTGRRRRDTGDTPIRAAGEAGDNKRKSAKASGGNLKPDKKRARTTRPFPASSFEDAALLPHEIQRLAGGQTRIRRLTLFEQLDRSPDSGLARQQIVNSNRYGLTQGSYKAEFLELTPKGALATNPDAPPRERTRARFELAIADIDPFNALYEALQGNKLPAQQVMRDQLTTDHGLSNDLAKEAVELSSSTPSTSASYAPSRVPSAC